MKGIRKNKINGNKIRGDLTGKAFIPGLLMAVSAAALVFCVAVAFSGWVQAGKIRKEEAYYLEKEEELKKTVREYLNENGFQNSGVMLTRIVCEDGSREYTLTVHHNRIDVMDEENRNDLSQKLMSLCFDDEQCTFRSEFLLPQICRN